MTPAETRPNSRFKFSCANLSGVTRVAIDQDITPTERLTRQLPASWNVTVGIEKGDGEVRDRLADVDVAFVTSRVPMTRAVIERARELDVIAKLGTGIDSIDLDAAREHGVTVTHTPGHNALSVAEHTLCLTLATARRLTAARNLIERGAWRDEYALGTRISGSTVGIVGFGNVGKRVGSLLGGFDVDILIDDPYVHRIDGELVGGTMTSLEDLLDESDIVVVTAELTEETRGLIGTAELDRMKESALLINAARGPIVEESALLDALRSGTIGGVGLDVFSDEPLSEDSELLAFDDVVVSPHVAAMTTESRTETIDQLVANVNAIFDGTTVPERYLATSL